MRKVHTMNTIYAEGTYNVRGIGSPEHPWLVRSASLDGLTARGEMTLKARGVSLAIDLREPSERGPKTHTIPVREVGLYQGELPGEGTLEGVYRDLIVNRGARITEAIVSVLEHPGVTVVQCTAGKDRTGLVVAILRSLLGDARDEIVADYALSSAEVRTERAAAVARMITTLDLEGKSRAETEQLHLESPAWAIEDALDLVDELGGPAAYLLRHGARVDQLPLVSGAA